MNKGRVERTGACRSAMDTLATGRERATEAAWGAALAHAAECRACHDRLDHLAGAILSTSADELPCAECQAGLPHYLRMADQGDDAGVAFARVSRHLADCPRCRAVADLLAPVSVAEGWRALPEPERYPRFDTSFLSSPEPAASRPRSPWLAGLWQRLTAPSPGRPAESPWSYGVLGIAAVGLLVLALVASSWALFRPNPVPAPGAPRPTPTRPAITGTPPTATRTRTPTIAATLRPGLATRPAIGAPPGTRPADTTATAVPNAEPSERSRRPTPPPTAGSGGGPTVEPYPPPPSQPTEGPTENPYPGPTDEPAPSTTPGT